MSEPGTESSVSLGGSRSQVDSSSPVKYLTQKTTRRKPVGKMPHFFLLSTETKCHDKSKNQVYVIAECCGSFSVYIAEKLVVGPVQGFET